MKCPKCDLDMKTVGQAEMHHNPTNSKEYDRTNYNCESCDVWLSVEYPKSE